MLAAAPKLGIELVTAEVANAEEAAKIYSDVRPGEIDAVFMPVDAPVVAANPALMELVKRDRIAVISPSGIRGNAVMSYGPDLKDMGVQMSVMVAKGAVRRGPGDFTGGATPPPTVGPVPQDGRRDWLPV